MRKMTFLDVFAGIGGFRLAFEKAGFECVGYIEKDKFARKTYEANFSIKAEWSGYDITKISDEEIKKLKNQKSIDIICAGFPCQSFSIAGNRSGFNDERGTMFFELCRFIKTIKPSIIVLENVKGLLSHGFGKTFLIIINLLDELGYDVEWQVLNSKDFDIPQNRERVIIIGYFRGKCRGKIFPIQRKNTAFIRQIGNISKRCTNIYKDPQEGRVFSIFGISPTLVSSSGGNKSPKIFYNPNKAISEYKKDKILINALLTPEKINKRQNGRRIKKPNEPMFTLTAQDRHGILIRNQEKQEAQIRKLTPLECFRLQAFPDSYYLNAKKAGLSDSQLYKQAGNSVTVNVIYELAKTIKNKIRRIYE